MVAAVVLAAGKSTRMGRPKALLPCGNSTFVRSILDALRDGGIGSAVVVARPGQPDLRAEVARAQFGQVVENPGADAGQLSSLLTGLEAVDRPDVDGILVTLVDVPLIRASTIRALLDRAGQSRAPVLRAVHGGQHGHPVIFMRTVFDALRRADPSVGAKVVVRSGPVEDVEVDDPGVLVDVDTPADYERMRGART